VAHLQEIGGVTRRLHFAISLVEQHLRVLAYGGDVGWLDLADAVGFDIHRHAPWLTSQFCDLSKMA